MGERIPATALQPTTSRTEVVARASLTIRAKPLRAVLAAASTLAAQPSTLVAQEEGSNLWRVLSITLGLAALAGILAALVVIGTSVLLSRGLSHGRSRWRLIRVRGSTPAKRGRMSGSLAENGLRSEAGSLVPLAERSRRSDGGQRSSPAAAPRQPARRKAAQKNATPPTARRSPKVLPKKLPSAGAPPPKKTLPGLSPPKKEGLGPAGLPPGKVLGLEARVPPAKVVEAQPSGLPPGKALRLETRVAEAKPVERPQRPDPPTEKAVEPEARVAPAKAVEEPRRPDPPTEKAVEPEARVAPAKAVERPQRPDLPTGRALGRETRATRAEAAGQAQRPVQPAAPQALLLPAEETPSTRWERCQVEWWRGYVTSDFYALAVGPDGEPYVAGRSERFRWWGSEPPPQRGGAAEAHARLLEQLAEEGWEATQTRGAWYGTRLRRRSKPTLRELSGRAQPGAS
ncbi:MAG: hypothetical protein ACRDM9_06255 [Gaiellaceae bacterium]